MRVEERDPQRQNTRKPLQRRRFPRAGDAGQDPVISSFASPEGFVIRCGLRTIVSPIPR